MKNRQLTVQLMGGIGNQLFQISKAIYLAKRFGDNVILNVPGGKSIEHQTIINLRAHELPVTFKSLEIDGLTRLAANLLLRANQIPYAAHKLINMLWNYFQNLLYIANISNFRNLKVLHNLGYSECEKLTNRSLIFGYFQTYRFIRALDVQSAMESYLKPRESIEMNEWRVRATRDKPVIIHVRLGDYVNERKFGVLAPDYYLLALEQLKKSFCFNHLWIFSDDINLCKIRMENLIRSFTSPQGIKTTWFTEKSLGDWDTWQIMRLGSAYIIANSSFSWWAAMMRIRASAPVLAPSKWFIEIGEPRDLIPGDWVRIPAWFEDPKRVNI